MMMKKCAIACSALFFLSFPASAQTYLNEDFQDGIPTDFLLIDGDGLTPSADMQNLGFAVGTPWLALTPKGETGNVACSTSWYSPKGRSDDWMILPPVTITSANAVLTWRARAADKKYRDGYVVYIATEAQHKEKMEWYSGQRAHETDELKWEELFSVAEEKSEWQNYEIALAAYAGQTIRLAFVNESDNKSRLYVDDIVVAGRSSVMLNSLPSPATPSVGNVWLSATAYTPGNVPVEGFTAGYVFDGETYRQTFTETLQPGQQISFVLNQPLKISDRQTLDYILFVETADGNRFEVPSTLTSYQRKVVGEEVTGTWCAWCVRGIVMLDSLKRTASDWFVGMAIHSGDPMECDYMSQLDRYFAISGLPNGVISRSATADPSQFFSIGSQAFKFEPVCVSMQLDAAFAENGSINTTTNLRFADSHTDADYRLAYAIIENNVSHPDDERYYQNNSAYSNEGSTQGGVMGGWELKPPVIPASEMVFQEVVRGYSGDFTGIEGSVPTEIEADQDITFDHSVILPETVDNPDEVEIIVMLIDGTDGHVVNAEVVRPLHADTAVRTLASVGKPAQVWTLGGQLLSSPKFGINIIRNSSGQVSKMLVR